MIDTMEKLLTVAEVADFLRVSTATVYRLIKKARPIPHYRVGHQVFFDRSEVMKSFHVAPEPRDKDSSRVAQR